jgi:transcriptional regulator of acetoin/glycerol metabolism
MQIDYAASTPEQAKGYGTGAFSDEDLRELRAQGLTIPAMAKVLGVSRGAIYQRVRAHLETALH